MNFTLRLRGLALASPLKQFGFVKTNTCSMSKSMEEALSPTLLKKFKTSFQSDKKNLMALNVCTKVDPIEICMQRKTMELANHVYTHKVDSETKPVTNQKNSGRCWIFAALNLMRIPFAKQHQVEEFEFSPAYLFFWDKIERCNFFLRNIVKVLQRGETIDGRLICFLLNNPMEDGGQFEMISCLVEKHGLIPKKCFPETFCSEASSKLNSILKAKLCEYTRDLQVMIEKEAKAEEIHAKILSCMEQLFQIISICLGLPPETFTWEYYNKNKAYCSVGPITPLQFYNEYVKPYCNLENKACLVNDPREQNPYYCTYTVDCLGNVIGGRRVIYGNVEIDELMSYTVESIKNNEPVYFGCDCSKWFAMKPGLHDLNIYDYSLVFGVDVRKSLTKAERLLFGESCMNHAMLFTGVSLDENGKATKFRVENSWGEDKCEKGYIMMTADWFREYVFEVVIDKGFLPEKVIDILKKEPKVLPAWDPMGALAS